MYPISLSDKLLCKIGDKKINASDILVGCFLNNGSGLIIGHFEETFC